jgi:hypothetical protein
MEVDQGLARKLHEDGIESAQQLVAGLDAQRLADLKRPWGDRQQKVGKKAEKILVYAGVLTSGKERMLGPVAIPAHDNYVMFDLEGMPPHLDDLEKIYLWGMRVYGKLPSAFMGVTAGFGTNGDQEGWAAFLDAAKKLFAVYGDIPFVHWHHYEKTHINQYIDRYGDPDGTAARVLRNLLDLLPIIKNAVALPLPSYSLKVVEEYIGFKRTQDEYGGSWAMAQFILATETDDEAQRSTRMSEILKYNKEDLAATWAVFEWLRGAGGTVHTTHGAGRGHQIPPEGIPQADYLVATSTQMAKILQLLENQQRQFELLLGTVSQRRVSRIPSDERGWQRVEPDETIEKNLFTSRPEIAAGIAATVQSFWPSFARLGQKTKNKWIFALHQAHFHAEADGLRAEMEETAVAWFAKAVELEVMSKIFLQFRDFVRRDSTLLHAAQEDGAYESTSAPLVKFISRNNPKLMLGDMAQAIKLSRNSSSCVFVELRKWIAAKCPAVDAAENFGEDLKQLATLAGPAKHGTVNASAVSKAQTLTRNILAVLAQ